jgi:hypothetical protein
MPNPVRSLGKRTRLTKRQKVIVRRLNKLGARPIKVYRRKGNASRVSVHDPFMDVGLGARVRPRPKVARYPQAYDTEYQSSHVTKRVGRKVAGMKKVRKGRKTGLFKELFFP